MTSTSLRRASNLAFVLAIAAATALGGFAAVARAADGAKPALTIGTKNFTEQYVLGELYKQALQAKGYSVTLKEDIGSSELIDTAFTSGKINFYPEYTGVLVADIAKQPLPKTAAATWAAAKKFEAAKRHATLLTMTPFSNSDGFGMLTTTAKKLGVKKIADMKKVKSFTYAGFPECRTRSTCLVGLKKVYGLTQVRFVPLGSISVYTLLDKGTVTSGDTFSTDPQLEGGKYTVLADTKHIFGYQNVAPVVSSKVATAGGSALASAVDAVSAKLTVQAMRAMNKAVAIDKQSPAAVAGAFLKANGLK
ncbi:MAG: osmoprotectant transport system substrate-binding protein [Gaiellales bacterium]|jgi:osmoprotectant transport system substrate-binding protein|nr:osmoprotectant transport system substrate-binding protein [Gaiellales bacterium]